MKNPYPKDVFKWNNPENLDFNRGRFNQHCYEIWENCKDEIIKKINEMLSEKEKELVLWSAGYCKDGKKLERKGFHKNPDFNLICNGYEQSLKALRHTLLIGSDEVKVEDMEFYKKGKKIAERTGEKKGREK